MNGIWYSRMIVVWLVIGILLLDGSLLYLVLTIPFEYKNLFLGWLFLGLNCIVGYALTHLWNIDINRT